MTFLFSSLPSFLTSFFLFMLQINNRRPCSFLAVQLDRFNTLKVSGKEGREERGKGLGVKYEGRGRGKVYVGERLSWRLGGRGSQRVCREVIMGRKRWGQRRRRRRLYRCHAGTVVGAGAAASWLRLTDGRRRAGGPEGGGCRGAVEEEE